MTIKHGNVLAAFQDWVRHKQKRRRHTITIRTLNELPLALQRDIGWDPARTDRH